MKDQNQSTTKNTDSRPYRQITTSPGQAYPLGATVQPDGVNFSLFTKNGTGVELLLFDRYDDPQPAHIIQLNPLTNKTFYYWHIFVHGIGHGQLYGYRVYGPYLPKEGQRYNPAKVLVDPYARCIKFGQNWSRQKAIGFEPNDASAMKAQVIDIQLFDWEGDRQLGLSFNNYVIYEMHVRGFTQHPSSGAANPGSFKGVIEKIPYLKELGVTAVELLPVQQFDPKSVTNTNPFTGERLVNYWGYDPVGFFAPHQGFCSNSDLTNQCVTNEFREMVKALHRAGIEVILDVVFNHTAEGGADGPTIHFRGMENRAYYLLEQNLEKYSNYSGTGNTLKTNHAIVRRLILDCLRYWVQEMHIDGFRFDLAAIFSRDETGRPMENPPILWEIESDPVLANTKIIAEAWDAAGLYQVGSFIGDRWAEWNGRYRDDVRRFIRGDKGIISDFSNRLMGSPDLYPDPGRKPHRSINYIACHDGFTLNDLVSYNNKYNLSNGEKNKDGTDVNYSWNCGHEGPAGDDKIERLRLQQIKNFIAVLFISQGTPMFLMGDEVRRSQSGNNNAYCQDNETSWLNWDLVGKNADLLRFVQGMIRFHRSHPSLNSDIFIPEQRHPKGGYKYLTWHGVKLETPDWGENSHSIAFTLHDFPNDASLHIIVNAYWEPLTFELPPLPENSSWRRAVDTSLDSPADLSEQGNEPPVKGSNYQVSARSVVILVAR